MKMFCIKKGKHHFKPKLFRLFWKKTILDYDVIFAPSCQYNLGNEDQLDTNKLIGLGYFSLRWNPHHTDSVRFGWRYDLTQNKIELLSYCYVNKERIIKSLGFCEFQYSYNITIIIEKDCYKLFICKRGEKFGRGITIPKTHNKKFSFLLGPYFGGNKVSPKDMVLYLQKL